MPRPPLIAIGLLSACVLAYEVLLTRLLSIVLWHHFAYMIISAAMLGYGQAVRANVAEGQSAPRVRSGLYHQPLREWLF